MIKQRKRLAAVLISSTLVLSSLASIIPQGTVMAAEDGVQEEQEIGSWEPIPEEPQQEAPAPEPVQEEAPAVEPAAAEAPAAPAVEVPAAESAVEAPAETAAPAAQTIDNAAVPAPVVPSTDAVQPQAVPAAEGTLAEGAALTDAEEVIVPSETTGETAVQDGLITVIYASGEGGSVSAESETVNFSEGGQAAGAQAAAYDGYVFTNWTAADGTVVSSSDYFVPVLTPDMTGEITYTAHFEKKAVEAPATRMVTAEYVAGKGGSVSRASETVDALAEGAAFLGSTAEAADGYAFVNWTAADGSEAGTDAAFVPSVSPETAERTVYTANFKKINTRPAQDFEGSVSGVSVRVHADEGRFPEGTTMHLAPVSRSSILSNDSVQDAVGEDREVVDAIAVDITFRNKNGDEIEPDGAISVSMSTSRSVSGESHQVLHIDDSGNASQVAGASADGASFEAGEFSIYVITGIDTSEQEPKIATYIFYGADGKVISTQKVKDGETVYAPTTPEKAGSKFIGWSYEKDATELQDGDPGVVDKFNATVSSTEEVKLYPVFQQAYYVFFMDDQGRVSTTKEGVSGNVISVEDVVIPLDSTQSVTGWYTEAELTNKVESVTLSNHNVTLYPKVETGHYLYFASGDGATYVKPVFVAANAGTAAPETPTRPGYTFKHWSASEGGAEYKFGNTIAEDTTLHAVWKANRDTKYTVIYWWENANDSNYSYHENSVETGTTGNKIDLTGISRSYDGFTLNTEKTDAANADAVIAGDGSTIVNVYYSRNIYEIKFFKAERELWVYSWSEMEGLRISAKYGASISDQWPSSTSKIWGTKKGDNGQGAQPYQSGISTMPLDGAKFYYVRQSGGYSMNLEYWVEGLDGTYTLDHTDSFKTDNPWRWSTSAEDHYDIEGFTYTNNVIDGTSFQYVSGNVYEVSFKYSRNSYSINFVNGDFNSSKTYKYEADISEDLITAPARPSGISSEYTFVGWFDNELGVGEPVKHLGKMPAHNITLYAKWAAPTYTGTVHLNIEGTGTPMRITIDYGGQINENDMPTVKDAEGKVIREGNSTYTVNVPANHTWAGWATKSGDDFIIYNFNEKIFGDITLYPYYINGKKYTVKYELGDGKGTAPEDSKKYAENSYADIQSAAGVIPPEGKTFLYWSHGTDKYYPGDKVKITGNLTLTAVYGDTSPETSITYHSNYPHDSGLKETTKIIDGQVNNTAITLDKAEFTAPAGYYFSHWEDAVGKKYNVGDIIGIDNTSENHLYAVWEQKKEITLKANSGTITYDGSTHSVSGVKTDTFTINGVSYTVSGYTTSSPEKKDAGNYPNIISGTYVVKDGNGADVTEQFTVKTEDGSLTISKRTVNLKSESASKAYDGIALTKPEVIATGDGFAAGEVSDLRATGTITTEGSVPNTITYTAEAGFNAGNYEITKYEGTLTITQNADKITVTAGSDTKVYDGTALTKNTYSIDGLPEGFTAVVTVSGSITDAGSVENKVTSVIIKKDDENVTDQFSGIETATGTLTVTKRTVKLKSESASKAFDGTALKAPNVTVTGDGFVAGEVSDITATGSITKVGSVTNTITYTENSGFKAINYEITKDEGTLTITQNEGEIVVNAKNDEKKYDGNPLTKNEADVTGLPKGYTAEVTVSGSITNAGTADNVVGTVVIKDASGNDVTNQFKTITKNNGTLTVTKRNVTLTSESVSREYDGTELTAPNVTVTGDGFVEGEVSDIKATGTITEVGNVPNSITYAKGEGFKADNYEITKNEGTLTITQNTAEIKVTADSADKIYDGTPLTKDTYSVTGLSDGFTAVVTVSGSITDVGMATNEVTSVTIKKGDKDVTKQFSGVTKVKGKLEVSKRKVILTSESASKAYDGTALTKPDVTIGGNGFVAGEVSELKATGSITKVGSVTNIITYTENSGYKAGNYEITKNEGTLTITKSDKEIVVNAKNATKPYDGIALIESGSEVSGLPEGYTADVTVNGTITDVGTADNIVDKVIIKDASGNDVTDQFKTITRNNGTLTVTKRNVTLTSESKTREYNGTALTAPDVTVGGDGFVNGEVTDIKATGTITKVGSAENTITYTEGDGFKAGNYDITKNVGTLTITANAAVITVTADSASKTYDGTALTKNSYSVTGLPQGFTAEVTVNGSITDAGTADNKVTGVVIQKGADIVTEQFSNITTKDGTLTVTPRKVMLKSESGSKAYDGTALTKSEVTVTGDGFVKGEVSDLRATGSITKAGSVKNTIEYTENERFKAKNYEITKDEGTLTITQNENEIVVNAKNASKTYDGTALTESGANVLGLPNGYTAEVTVSGSITNSGTADNVVGTVVIKDASGSDVTDQFKTITKNNGTLTVTKRNVTLTSESVTREYNGTALTAPNVTVNGDGFVDGEVTDLKATGSITEVGSTQNTITYTRGEKFKEDNYNIEENPGELTITKSSQKFIITSESAERKYDGTPLTAPSVTVVKPQGFDQFTVEAKVTGSIINAGEARNIIQSVIIRNADGKNVTDHFEESELHEGALKVLKRQVTLTSDSAKKEYDGTPLTAKNVTVSGDGFAEGEYAEYDVTGSQTEVGQSENTFTYKVIKGASQPAKASVVQKLLDFLLPKMDVSAATSDDPADNYDITVVYGTLIVTQKSEPEPKPEQKPDQKPEGGGGSGSATGERAVAIYKVDEQTGAYLAGAQFALYDSTGKLIGTYETNEQGFLKASYLSNGSYYFVETKAPDGYAISQNRIDFYLDQSRSYSNDYPWNIKVTNRRMQAVAAVQTPQAPAVTPAPAAAVTNSNVPATGDESRMQFYGWLALFAAAAMSGWFVVDRKRRGRK